MNVRILNNLKTCVPFVPRTYANALAAASAQRLTQVDLTSLVPVSGAVLLTYPVDRYLKAGDDISINAELTGQGAPTLVGLASVATARTALSVFRGIGEDPIDATTAYANIWFRRAALFACTQAGAANAHDLAIGYQSNLLPVVMAPGSEFSLIAPDGGRMNLADVWVKPAAAGANGIVCILY